jgi:hypothetical protein
MSPDPSADPALSSLLRLLEPAVRLHRPELAPLLDRLGAAPLAVEEREALREALADELCARGLGPGDEPNELGRRIEAAIDRLGHL